MRRNKMRAATGDGAKSEVCWCYALCVCERCFDRTGFVARLQRQMGYKRSLKSNV